MALDRSPIAAEIRATLAVAAPLAGANLAQMAMSVTNVLIVGHLGATTARGGRARRGALHLAPALVPGRPDGGGAVGGACDRRRGPPDRRPGRRRRADRRGAVLAAPVILILTALPLLLAGLGYDPDLVAEIGRFLQAIRWGAPAFLGFAVLRFVLVAAFRTRIVMVISLLAVPLNAGLNWILIFGHFGMPALGSAGSGCATAIVQWLMLCWLCRLHGDHEAAGPGQNGPRCLARDPPDPAARPADRRLARARDRAVRHDRHPDGGARRRRARGAPARLQRRRACASWCRSASARRRPCGSPSSSASAPGGGTPRRVRRAGARRVVHGGNGGAAVGGAAQTRLPVFISISVTRQTAASWRLRCSFSSSRRCSRSSTGCR